MSSPSIATSRPLARGAFRVRRAQLMHHLCSGTSMRTTLDLGEHERRRMTRADRGFSLIEIVAVVAIVLLLGAIAAPVLLSTIRNINLRYAAVNFSGLLQRTRMEAARKNSFYPVRPTTLGSGYLGYYADLDRNQTLDSGEPVVALGRYTVYAGTGSGAPQESSFTSSFSFTQNSASTMAAFNARGLPCGYIQGASTCPQAAGQGFFYFLSGPQNTWASVVITPSGRVQVWTYDNSGNGSWIQQ